MTNLSLEWQCQFSSIPKPNKAKSYFIGSFSSNSFNLFVNSITALKSFDVLFNKLNFLDIFATCVSNGINKSLFFDGIPNS